MAEVEEVVGGLELDVDDGELYWTKQWDWAGVCRVAWDNCTGPSHKRPLLELLPVDAESRNRSTHRPPHPQDSAQGELCSLIQLWPAADSA